LTVTPAAVTLAQSPLFKAPLAKLRVQGGLGDATTVDLSAGSSGTTYVSANPLVAAVSADGTVLPVSAGDTVIHIVNSQGGNAVDVPVTVTSFSPAPFAAYNTPGFAYNVDIDGKLAFVADGPGGLQILDVTGGATVGKLSFGGFPALDVRLRGKLAAVALGDGGFALVDVADPSKPTLRSHSAPTGSTADLWPSGNMLYAASSDGLHVYDITDPSAPLAIGAQSFAAAATAVAGDATRGLVVVLTSEPALVVLQANGPMPWPAVSVPLPAAVNQADDVILSGTSAYVANGTAGLIEVDLTNPASPSIKTGSTLVFNALGVALQRSAQGTILAAADNKFVNAVPLFDERLDNTFNIDFSSFPGDIQSDANSTGIALGDGFGVVTVGDVGIQVFLTRQLTDNAGVPPTVALTQPITGGSVPPGDFYFFAATAIDDVSVASVDFLVDGVVVASDARAPFSASVPAGAPCTTQTLEARATDLGGNVGLSLPLSIAVLCADGQPCAAGADCASGTCSAGTCQSCGAPGFTPPDCAALKAACPNTSSGTYTIDPDGAGPGAPFQAYCEMKLGGGGWTMIAKLSNQDDKHWIDAKTSWTSAAAYGNAADLSTGQDAKSPAWGALAASELLFTDDANKALGGYVQTTSSCLGGLTPSAFFTDALASYPDISGDTYYRQCATFNNYIPNWTIEPGFYDQVASSPANSLNQGYLSVAYTNGGDTQAVISFYSLGLVLSGPDYTVGYESEADCGLGVSEHNEVAFGLNDPQQEDLGATQFFDTAYYQTAYPETVFLFAR
ncbi:MAG: fibrinogen-like YCDxxxxGGGW domain-containing protein, partial [Minicystis sp.]